LILKVLFISTVIFFTLAKPTSAEKISVFVSILPQKYFVEKIGGDRLNVFVMVEPGANPHSYEPKPQQMMALAQAKAYFAIGVNFEEVWLPRITASNPKMMVVKTDAGISKIPMQADHLHGIKDPHIWTSPPLVKIQASNILRGLLAVDPTNRFIYEANYKKFVVELEDLDAELKTIFKGKMHLRFMVFHPAWGYFARAYGLEQVPIETGGKEPKPAQLRQLIERAQKQGIKVIFVQPQLSTRSAETIAGAIGGKVVFADPLAYE
jgi:zinc transport system substrate-binding protein